MPNKKPFTPRTMEVEEANQLDRSLNTLYKAKLEAVQFKNSGTFESLVYPNLEFGVESFSATGSAVISKTIALNEKHFAVVVAFATTDTAEIGASVTDITLTSITVAAWAQTAVSGITTASFNVFFSVLCQDP